MMPLRNVLSQIELRASLAVMGIVQLVVPFLGETESDTTHTRQARKSEVITYMYIHAKKTTHPSTYFVQYYYLIPNDCQEKGS